MTRTQDATAALWVVEYKSDDGMVEIENKDALPWHEAPIPSRFHRCTPQTRGRSGLTRVYRCACGAISDDAKHWSEKNERRH